jgi:hypothetical protein
VKEMEINICPLIFKENRVRVKHKKEQNKIKIEIE